jgi:Putative metal-binding motif
VLGAGLVFISGCVCGTPVGGDDGGEVDAGTPCEFDTDCQFGEACVGGYCGTPITPDAGVTCTRNEDCPMGQVCLPSTGECFTPMGNDSGEEDGGVITGVCNPGDTSSCGSSKLGLCRLGTANCEVINGAYAFGACTGNVEPVPEVCNGLDEDCDGLIDDGFADISCGVGECRRTVPGCVNGAVNTCAAGSPSTEVCDGKDNDCNGQGDDMPLIVCGTGSCRRTAVACDGGVPGVCTPGGPTSELCNAQDDDCNGSADDGFFFQSCGVGVCFNSVYPCQDGGVVTCQPLVGSTTENCATAFDDNCNGLINEGCACTPGQSFSCYNGPNGTADAGVCRYGIQSCDGGQYGPCVGEVVPAAEACNNLDDNCNGTVDDMGTTSCGMGQCFRTVQNCIAGAPQTCVQGTPTTEVCNNLDDNCDGTNDNGIPNLTCGVGACFVSVPACVGGANNTCTPGAQTTESCNGVDDDCDGTIDNNIPPASCSTGQQGPCSAGNRTCIGGLAGCLRTYSPVAEICNNTVDDDCNGTVDIGPGCCDAGVDLDFDGYDQCRDCVDTNGAINPDAGERCNGYDDNCRLGTDEGFDKDNDGYTVCGTMDAGGIDVRRIDCNDDAGFVFPLKTTDCGALATPNTPNTVDDNCNGYTDETCGCQVTRDRDGDGANECIDCDDNAAWNRPGGTEVCDGRDNDCSRATVDNCGVSDPCGSRQGSSYVPFPAGTDRCRPDLICVSNVSTGELTCGSFCNQTAGAGLNDSCAPTEGCLRNLIDSDNLHLCSVTPVGGGAAGATCSIASACRSGDCELADGTGGYCTDKCTHEAGCPNNMVCHVYQQPVTSGPFVIGNYYFSQCRPDARASAAGFGLAPGAACTAPNQCQGGTNMCVGGRCAQTCCTSAECAAGYGCTLDGPRSAIGYNNTAGEGIDSVVPACTLNAGTRVAGAACTANSQCRSNICDRNLSICVDLCCNDSSCLNGTTCEPVNFRFSNGRVTFIRACVFSPVPARIEQR